jgi:hypothetical protein
MEIARTKCISDRYSQRNVPDTAIKSAILFGQNFTPTDWYK